MARVQIIKKSRKETKCSKCGAVIPVGSMYYKAEPYTGPIIVRCKDCKLEEWETSGSEFKLTCGSIQNRWQEDYDIETAAQDIADALQELEDTCQESLDNMPEGLQEGDTGMMLQDRIDMLDGIISDLQDIDFEDILSEATEAAEGEYRDEHEVPEDQDLSDEQRAEVDEVAREDAEEEAASQIDDILGGLEY